MTVTDQRLANVVTAVQAYDDANRALKRALAVGEPTEEMLTSAGVLQQDVVDLDVTLAEVDELAASYELARDWYADHPDVDNTVERYRKAASELHWFRVAHRMAEVAAGRRNSTTTLVTGTADFGVVASKDDPS